MTDFTMKTDAEGVAIITWDVPKKSMNVLSEAGIKELVEWSDRVEAEDKFEQAAAELKAKGLV